MMSLKDKKPISLKEAVKRVKEDAAEARKRERQHREEEALRELNYFEFLVLKFEDGRYVCEADQEGELFVYDTFQDAEAAVKDREGEGVFKIVAFDTVFSRG